MSKFFCRPNLATDQVVVSEKPWEDFPVPQEVLDLPKEDYKKRWNNPAVRHCLFSLAEGQNPSTIVSIGNQAAALHGFVADYDGMFTTDMVDAIRKSPQSRFKPAYWCLSQSRKLHLVWLFDRPVTVAGNRHADALLKVIALKIKAVLWGVGYDAECETVTQVMDIGREWHVFRENSFVPAEEVIKWDTDLFKKNARSLVDEVVSIPFTVVVDEIRRRQWPHTPPDTIIEGTRCIRFWDASADNATGAQFTKDGIRVYTPHDGGFKSWKSLLGKDFCDQYTAKSMAPFFGDTFYCHTKDEYWRFFRLDEPAHFERRTEKVLRRDLMMEARLSPKIPKGAEMSEIDEALYTISRKNAVDNVAPIIYRPGGRIHVDGLGWVLNTSMVVVRKPAGMLASVEPEDLEKYPDCPEEYRENPGLCAWDNPFAVQNFPHIHRLLTCYFMDGQKQYESWANRGYPLKPEYFDNGQLVYLLAWMSHFYFNAARMSANPGRGQALIIAGPPGTGKSFFARELLSRLMGGKTDAEKFYLEGNRFNSGIVSSPVHIIDDKLGSAVRRARLQFTEALKIVAANAVLRYEAKFGSAVETVPWAGRVVVLANDDAQSMSVMPDLDMSTRDKFMMLKFGTAKFHWGTDAENIAWLDEELPYFARFLLGYHDRIPAAIRDDRFGVKAVQHKDMAQASAENGLTQVVLEVLEACAEKARAAIDPANESDRLGWAKEGNAVSVFKWIAETEPGLAREVIDSRTLQQCLSVLYRNGGYNLELDEETRRWRIPFHIRKSEKAS